MTDELLNGLKKRAATWASQITKKAHANLGKYRSLIQVESHVEEKSGKVEIRSIGRPTNPKKPVARAYEYGSGIHSRLSVVSPKQIEPKGKIVIKPIHKKYLAFFWEKALEIYADDIAEQGYSKLKFLPDGRVLFKYVQHPGVKAANKGKGYLAPAVTEVRKQIRKEVPKEMRDAYIGVFRKAFKK